MTKTTKYHAALLASLDTRAAYEDAKNPDNLNIQRTLKGIRASLTSAEVARVMASANVAEDFLNHAERGNARFNVYAAEKVANIARIVAGQPATLNHYTRAIYASARACGAAGVPFTHADAVACCTLEVKADPAKPLTRYAKHVAPNTASTQASSSVAALKTFGILVEGKTAAGQVAYAVKDAPQSDALASWL